MKHRWTRGVLGILLVVAAWLAGCGPEPPRLSNLADDAVILAFGDSLTRGTGAGGDASYPRVLADLTGRRVINAGIPGEVSAEGVKRLPALLEQHRPALVVLCHGGNDILRRRDREQLRANLERMIADSRASGAEVVLLGVPDFGVFVSTAEVYGQVAEATGVPLEQEILSEVLGDRSTKSDTVHPNAEGYRRVAEAVAELLRRSGAI